MAQKCKLHFEKVRFDIKLENLTELFAGMDHPAILAANDAQANRFSAWAASPIDKFSFESGQETPFEKLQTALSKYRLDAPRPCTGMA